MNPKEAVRLAINAIIAKPYQWDQSSWHMFDTNYDLSNRELFTHLSDKDLLACMREECGTTHCFYGWIDTVAELRTPADMRATAYDTASVVDEYLFENPSSSDSWITKPSNTFETLYLWAKAYIADEDTSHSAIMARVTDTPISRSPHTFEPLGATT